jgi:hypothetical protein
VEIESEDDWSLEYARHQQEECPTLSKIKSCLDSKTTLKTSDKELAALAKELQFCFIGNNGVLRRKSKDGKVQIIVPQKLTSRVLKMMHDGQGILVIQKH